jgi:hypothetical protein
LLKVSQVCSFFLICLTAGRLAQHLRWVFTPRTATSFHESHCCAYCVCTRDEDAKSHETATMQESDARVRRRPLSGPPERKHQLAQVGGFRGAPNERASSVALLPPHAQQGVRAAATPMAASRGTGTISRENAPASTRSRLHTTSGPGEGACSLSLPPGVKHVVAGAACSLLLQTHPPCYGKLDWDVSLVSYHHAHQHAARNPQKSLGHGVPVAHVLGTSSSATGVQSCSFVATQAGVLSCRARVRGRAMQPCSLSINVTASEPCDSTSRVYLVHPLPGEDVVLVRRPVFLRLMVRLRMLHVQHCCRLTLETGQLARCVGQSLPRYPYSSHPLQARLQQRRWNPYFCRSQRRCRSFAFRPNKRTSRLPAN